MVKQGDIIRLNFDPQTGHEQRGRRPALVVNNNTFNRFSSNSIYTNFSDSILLKK
jgi:mRNA interferase MazF